MVFGLTLPVAFGGFGVGLVVVFAVIVWLRLQDIEFDVDDLRVEQNKLIDKVHEIAGTTRDENGDDSNDSG